MKRELTVRNKLGLHARPAARFVKMAMMFHSDFVIRVNRCEYDGKRMMDLLLANMDQGTTFELETLGEDAEEALNRAEQLMAEIEIDE